MRKGGDGAVTTGGTPGGAVPTGGAPVGGADALLTPDSASDVKGTGGTAGTGGAGNSDASAGTRGVPGSDGPIAPDGTGVTDGPTGMGGSRGSDGPPATGGTDSCGIPGGTSAGGWGGVGGVPVIAGTTGTVDRTPGIASFTASPPTIGAGQSSTLRWVAYGATTLSLDQGIGSVLGATSVVVKPAQTTTYTLSWNGTVSARATVTVAAAGFWATGSMAVARTRHTATLLSNGKVLIAGGLVGYTALASAEIYDPAAGKCTATGSMAAPREYHTATLLANGNTVSLSMALAPNAPGVRPAWAQNKEVKP